jgi:hypothetical protein
VFGASARNAIGRFGSWLTTFGRTVVLAAAKSKIKNKKELSFEAAGMSPTSQIETLLF